MFTGVPHDQIDGVWDEIERDVEMSCKRGGWKFWPEDYKRFLKSRDMQLWVSIDGAISGFAITEIVNYPRKKGLRIHVGSGDYINYFDQFIQVAEAWGRHNGCAGGEAITRPGFFSFFKRNGWRKTQIYVEKEF